MVLLGWLVVWLLSDTPQIVMEGAIKDWNEWAIALVICAVIEVLWMLSKSEAI